VRGLWEGCRETEKRGGESAYLKYFKHLEGHFEGGKVLAHFKFFLLFLSLAHLCF
jgi:hypothetical protein